MHFTDEDFVIKPKRRTLKKSAIPTVNIWKLVTANVRLSIGNNLYNNVKNFNLEHLSFSLNNPLKLSDCR